MAYETDAAIIYVRSWLAVRSEDAPAVAAALGLGDAQPCAVKQGLDDTARDRRRCFVAPSIDGWTLVFADAIAFEGELTSELSRRFGEVIAYHSDAKRDAFFWERSIRGQLVRSVGLINGEASSEGDRDPAEPETIDDISELDVLDMARAWSIDPNRLLRLEMAGRIGARATPAMRT